MSHEDHPGHDAVCRARLTINAAPHSTSSNGYACKVSGGHCLPSERCAERLKIFDAHKAREARFEVPDFSKTILVWPYVRTEEAKARRVGLPCKHWFIVTKHPCGPATQVCQDCGHEEAL